MQNTILRILRENAKISHNEIALRLDIKETDVDKIVAELEKNGIIKGYQAVIDDSILPESQVKAVISVNVLPQREGGFDSIAKRLAQFPEVASLYLVSGGFDLEIEVQGETLQEVAAFVSAKLSTIEGVTSTTTHFILKKYKESGRLLEGNNEFKRLKISP
jgi:DNA-binding Lrp family transcriptional regulator